MTSRKEQKAQLRREREQREAEADAAKRRRLIGYGVGGGVALVAVVIVAVLLMSGGGAAGSDDVLPDGGSVPELGDTTDVKAAAKAAGCEFKTVPGKGRAHATDPKEEVKYATKPPTSGRHFVVPAEDAAYEEAPREEELVHTMEHGRVIIWFKGSLPADDRANLKAFYDADPYQIALTPDPTGMKYAVAATAWDRDPAPNGTGQLLGCPKLNDEAFTAIEALKDAQRGRGPEPIP